MNYSAEARLEAYTFLIAQAAAELAGEDSKFPPPPVRTCATIQCPERAEPGCGGRCLHCWHERRALARLY